MINLENYREVYEALKNESYAVELFNEMGIDVRGDDSKSISTMALLIMLLARGKKLEGKE